MVVPNLLLLNWNVRGLNAQIKWHAIKDMISAVKATLVCLQETKLAVISEATVTELLGASFKSNFSFLPTLGTCGGILIVASDNHFRLMSSSCTKKIHVLIDVSEWTLTDVYRPQSEADKFAFLDELKGLKQSIQGEWLIVWDFNLIYKVEDKNNSRLNQCLMGSFKLAIDDLELRELPLQGRKYTWTSAVNSQGSATMARIDRIFSTTSWEELFPVAHLHAWASTISDHCPHILQ
jgi:exonuclease III